MSQPRRDGGFTLVELLVTMSLLGIMMALSISGWVAWTKSTEHSGTADELESVLRQTQQRAVTEGRAMCVRFDVAANEYTVYRGECDGTVPLVKVLGPATTAASDVHLVAPGFAAQSGIRTDVTFYARGTAWPGAVKVTRTGSSKVYTVHVEGLTGRVSLT